MSRTAFLMAVSLSVFFGCGGAEPVEPPDPPVPSTVSPSVSEIRFVALRDTLTVQVTVRDQSGEALPAATVSWSTDDPVVAQVTPTGLVTSLGVGSAILTVKSGTATATVQVAVTQEPAVLMLGDNSVSLVRLGAADTLRATVRDARNNIIPGAPVTWASADTAVARVDSAGVVSAAGGGRTEITVSAGPVSRNVPVAVAATFGETVPALLDTIMGRFGVPGVAVGVIEDGNVTWAGGRGVASTNPQRSVASNTPFFIASISKSFTGWAVSNLAARGIVDLDAPVETFFNTWSFPPSSFDASASTLRLLLAHQGGASLCCYPGFPPGATLPTTEQSLNGATNGAGRVELVYVPGSQTVYAGGGITVTQLAIEDASGKNLDQFMKDNIFGPLGMTASTFRIDDVVSTVASGFNDDGSVADFPRFAALGAAGMISSVDDMLTFAQALIRAANGSTVVPGIDQATLDWLLDTQPFVLPAIRYQLGNQVRNVGGMAAIGHAGGHPGWATQYQVAPRAGHAVVVLVNRSMGGGAVHNAITCRWFEAMTNGISPPEYCWVFN